jgi:hypothetical protein
LLSSLTLDGLLLLGGENYDVHDPVEGLEAPSFRISDYEKPGEDGGVVVGSYHGLRPITLNGRVNGASYAAYEANRQALEEVCAVSRDSNGFPRLKLLEFTTLAGSSYFTYVQVQKLRLNVGRGTTPPFLVQLVAPDPRLYLVGQQSTGVVSLPTGGGFLVPFVLPVTSSPSSGGAGSVSNSGNILTYPRLTLRGQLTNPYILNGATAESFQLNRVLAGGETVVIDMAEKTIMLGGTTPLLTAKSDDSTWWGLVPGPNPISFSSGSASDDGTLEITWHNARSGV